VTVGADRGGAELRGTARPTEVDAPGPGEDAIAVDHCQVIGEHGYAAVRGEPRQRRALAGCLLAE
jgi:hypothetical protein